MNIDEMLINYFFDFGGKKNGVLFAEDEPSVEITKVEITPDESIEFYNGEELVYVIEGDDIKEIYIGTNKNYNQIPYTNKIVVELKRGFNVVRFFTDLSLEIFK